VLNGFKSAFLPFHEKQRYLAAVSKQLEAFHDDGSVDEVMLEAARAAQGRRAHLEHATT
jgi:adenosine deaminase